MKKDKTPPAVANAPAGASAPQAPERPASLDLGLVERRRTIRPLPVPEAIESDGDTVWGDFQSLSADDSDT